MKKKLILSALCTAAMAIVLCACGGAENNIAISLEGGRVMVDGAAAAQDAGAVYVSQSVETHPDAAEENKDVENTVIHITQAGTYTVSGTAADTRILVEAGGNDAVTIALDGADISCATAPVILVKSGKDTKSAGEGGVTIELCEGSQNKLSGSHIVREKDEDIKYDGAISSDVSLVLAGEGSLELMADNEGIECKMHLTVNSGRIAIDSQNDALNASEDGVSVITVNGGELLCRVSDQGEEGDGIDSNGTIVINGGTVLAYANPNSQDSGLDASGGTTVNGGTVLASGNMMDMINADSKQAFMLLGFSEKQAADTLYVLTDESDTTVTAFSVPCRYTSIQLSTPELSEGRFRLYKGGLMMAEIKDGLCTNITSYSVGTRMQHGGAQGGFGMGRPPERPEGMEPPKDSERPGRPEGQEPPEMPEGGERPRRPEGERGPGGMHGGMSAEVSDIFEITAKNKMFMNVTVAEMKE